MYTLFCLFQLFRIQLISNKHIPIVPVKAVPIIMHEPIVCTLIVGTIILFININELSLTNASVMNVMIIKTTVKSINHITELINSSNPDVIFTN